MQYSEDNQVDTSRTMTTTPAASRIVKKEQTKLLRQTLIWIGVSVVVLVLFLVLILPNAPRLLATFLDSGAAIGQQDTIPPQVPVLNTPPVAVKEGDLELSGYAEPESQVIFVLNGNQAAEVTADGEGGFTQTLQLQEGENQLEAFSRDAAENESALSHSYLITLDTTAPSLELAENIQDQMEVVGKENRLFTIAGQTEASVKVAINDRFLFARADGSFSYQLQLGEGENTIHFVITDKAGNEYTQDLVIRYKP